MKEIKRNINGITLVALVVTIIVLLILAGVAISLTIGNNGLFKRAGNATSEYEKARIDEGNRLQNYEDEIDDIDFKGTIIYHVDNDAVYQEKAKRGKSAIQPTTFTPEKEGWTFVGWRENNEVSSDVLTEKIAEQGELNLYAVFKKEVSISYNANGGSSTPATQKAFKYYNNGNNLGATFKIASAIARSKYTFVRWRLNSTSGTAYSANANITLEDNAVFYAEWEEGTRVTSIGRWITTSYDTGVSPMQTNIEGAFASSGALKVVKRYSRGEFNLTDYNTATVFATISVPGSGSQSNTVTAKISFSHGLSTTGEMKTITSLGSGTSEQIVFDVSKMSGVHNLCVELSGNIVSAAAGWPITLTVSSVLLK